MWTSGFRNLKRVFSAVCKVQRRAKMGLATRGWTARTTAAASATTTRPAGGVLRVPSVLLPSRGLHMTNCGFLVKEPELDQAAFIADCATILGDVHLGRDSSVFYGSILRADINRISIGAYSNIQDGTVMHLTQDLPVSVGAYVTVGHRAVLHACTVEDDCLIGMGAIVMDGAVIKRGSIVGAGALVTPGTTFEERSLIVGSPARAVRKVSDDELKFIRHSAVRYVQTAKDHQQFNAQVEEETAGKE